MAKTKSKLSTIEIAAKQRHMLLLGKVKENKALNRAELDELRRYERRAKLTTAGPRRLVKPVVLRTERKERPGKKKASDGKKRRTRLPIRPAKVRWLALECESLTEAEATIKTRKSLAEIFKKHPRLQKAWDRGRFLREVKDVAAQSPSTSQAAGQLGFTERTFEDLLSRDAEVKDIWHQQQLQLYVTIKGRIFDLAEEGNPWAVKTLDDFLQAHAGLKADVLEVGVTTDQLSKLTGKSIRTLYNWRIKYGLPQNSDKTYDLKTFFLWYEEFLLKKTTRENASAVVLDPYRAMKVEKLKMELARHKNETLDRSKVIIQLVAWARHIVSYCDRHNEELSRLCIGQPREKVLEIHRQFFRDFHASIARVPKELHLSDDKGKELEAFLLSLKPENGGPGHGN